MYSTTPRPWVPELGRYCTAQIKQEAKLQGKLSLCAIVLVKGSGPFNILKGSEVLMVGWWTVYPLEIRSSREEKPTCQSHLWS